MKKRQFSVRVVSCLMASLLMVTSVDVPVFAAGMNPASGVEAGAEIDWNTEDSSEGAKSYADLTGGVSNDKQAAAVEGGSGDQADAVGDGSADKADVAGDGSADKADTAVDNGSADKTDAAVDDGSANKTDAAVGDESGDKTDAVANDESAATPDVGEDEDGVDETSVSEGGEGSGAADSDVIVAEEEITFEGNEANKAEEVVEIPFVAGYQHFLGDNQVSVVKSLESPELLPVTYKTPNLPALRDQNPHGSCWSFTSMSLAEINRMQAVSDEQDYSEVALCYFTYNTVEDPLGGTAGDWNKCKGGTFMDIGGNLSFSGQILAGWVGASDDTLAPYSSISGALKGGLASDIAYNDKAHLTGYYVADIKNDRDTVKRLIYQYGSVGTSIYAHTTLPNVAYNAEYNSYYVKNETTSNHAVTIVGWDDTFSKEHFNNLAPGNGAWLVRNSWWKKGIEEESYYGYFWLSYYDAGLTTDAHAFEFADAGNYQHNYQYDGSMQSLAAGTGSKVEAANVFTAKACDNGEQVMAASFVVLGADVDYTVKIYRGITDENNPVSGVLWDTVTGKTTCEGYYTVPFSKPVDVDPGEKFSIVVTLEKDAGNTSIAAEYTINYAAWYETNATASAGQSFLRYGSAWQDYGKLFNANLRIKAFTNDMAAGTSSAPCLKISGSDEAYFGDKASYKAMIFPKSADQGDTVNWTSSDPTIASVDADGNITVHNVGEITLSASAGTLSAEQKISCYPHAPAIVYYNMDTTNKVKLYWSAVAEADYYIVVKPDGTESEKIYGSGEPQLSYEDTTLVENTSILLAQYDIYVYKENGSYVMGKSNKVQIYLNNSCSILYEVGEGENHPNNPKEYTYSSMANLYPATPPTGYSFGGWFKDAECTERITSIIGSALKGNITLYAKYVPNTYFLRYNANFEDGSKTSYTSVAFYNIEITLAGSELFGADAGRAFDKWNTKKDGSGTDYYSGQTVEKLTEEADGYFDLYALYKEGVGGANFKIQLSEDGKVVPGTKLTLSTTTEGASIYYTTDGSEPSVTFGAEGYQAGPTTKLYNQPFALTEDMADQSRNVTVKAIVVKKGSDNSAVIVKTYELQDVSDDWGDIPEEVVDDAGFGTAAEIPEGLWVSGVPEIVPYTGGAYVFNKLEVYFGKLKLRVKKDYTIKYSSNKKAGTAKITISGKGNYSGKTTKTFKIAKLNIEEAITENLMLRYNGRTQKGKPKVRYNFNGKVITLKSGRDFTYVYEMDSSDDFKEVGDYKVIIRGKGNYEGELEVNERITDCFLMPQMSYSIVGDVYDGGNPVEPKSLSVKNGSYELNMLRIDKSEFSEDILAAKGNEGYDCVYYIEGNDQAGDAVVTFVGTGVPAGDDTGYDGTVTKTYLVEGQKISSASINGLMSSYVMREGPVNPFQDGTAFLTSGSGERLVLETDENSKNCHYAVNVVSGDMSKQGTVTIEIVGRNSYYGKVTKSYSIVGTQIGDCNIKMMDDNGIIYTGAAIKAITGITAPDGSILTEKVDYTAVYSNNINAGTAKVTVNGIGKYGGSKVISYKILPCSINSSDVEMEDFSNTPYTPKYTNPYTTLKRIRADGTYMTLEVGKDYKIKCQNNKYIHSLAEATFEGIGNYTGTIKKEYIVVNGKMSNTTVLAADIVYQRKGGLYSKAAITLTDVNGQKLTNGTDYTIEGYVYAKDTAGVEVKGLSGYSVDPSKGKEDSAVEDEDILPIGAEIKVVLNGCGNYQGTTTAILRVVEKDIAKAKVTVKSQMYAEGKKIEPGKEDITVRFGGGSPLDDSDYEIIGYQDNTSKGNGVVILKGLNRYGGTKSVKFKIAAKSFTIFGITVNI